MSEDNDFFDDANENNDIHDMWGNELHRLPDGSWVIELPGPNGGTVYKDENGNILTQLTDVTNHQVLTNADGRVVLTMAEDPAGNRVFVDQHDNIATVIPGWQTDAYSGGTQGFDPGFVSDSVQDDINFFDLGRQNGQAAGSNSRGRSERRNGGDVTSRVDSWKWGKIFALAVALGTVAFSCCCCLAGYAYWYTH